MSEHPHKPSREAQKIDELMRGGFPLKESREAVDLHKGQDGTYRMKEEVLEEKESKKTDEPRFIATESGLVTDTLASEGRDLTPAEEREELHKAAQGTLQIEDKKLRESVDTVPAVIAEDRTPSEERVRLKELVKQAQAKLYETEGRLKEADEDFYQKSAFGQLAAKIFGGDNGRKLLEAEVNEAAGVYAQSLEQYLRERLDAKGLDRYDGKGEKVAERYHRMVTWRDVIKRSEEERAKAKKETLEARGSPFYERSLRWLGERSAGLDKKLGKTGGRIARTLIFSTAGTSLALAFGPASAAVLGGVWAARAARSLVGSFGGAAVGTAAGKVYEKTGGARAARRLEESKDEWWPWTSTEDIAEKRQAHRSGTAEAIERKRRWWEAGTALISGAGLSLSLPHALAGHQAVEAVHGAKMSVATGGQSDSYETFKQTLLQRDLGNKDMDKFFDPSAHAPGAAVPGVPASAHVPIEVAPVHAVAGHGYEEMLYKLGQEIHDKYPHGLPQGTGHNSDAWKLWHAAAKGDLKGEVHQIAMGTNGGHGFFNPDGTSIRIDPHAHVTIGVDGQVHFGDPTHPDMIHAPAGAPTTPPYQPEAHIHHAGGKPSAASTPASKAPPAAPTSPMETAPSTASGHAPLENATPPAGMNTPPHAEIPQGVPDISHEGPTAVSPNHFPPTFTMHGDIATTANGLDVPLSQPHLYAGWNGDTFAYGGSPAERAQMILGYLKENTYGVVYTASNDENHMLAWQLINDQLTPTPVRHGGFFGFFRSLAKAPDPSDLQKLIK